MRPNRLGVGVLLGLCLTATVPVVATLWMWRERTTERQMALISDIAKQALVQAERIAQERDADGATVNALPPGTECSESGRTVMRRLILQSPLLRGIGRLEGNTITCSTFTGSERLNLGPPDHVSDRGVKTWTNVRLFDGGDGYLVSGRANFVGVISKQLPRNNLLGRPDLRLGIFAWTDPRLMYNQDDVQLGEILREHRREGTFRHGNEIVAIARSRHYDLVSVAVLPVYAPPLASAATLLPILIGILAALLMSYVFLRAMRLQTALPRRLRAAIRNGELLLRYQPIVNLQTGLTTGAEALVRWQLPTGEIIEPDVFIPVAEATGVISLITDVVLNIVEDDIRSVRRLHPNFRFNINFAADDLHDPRMADRITALIASAELEPGAITVEITERSFIRADLARENIKAMRASGAKVAIDDFGTGYSSLSMLTYLDFDCIKVDKLFVQALGVDAATSNVAMRIIDMANDLGVCVVAEGIETEKQAELLRELGVELGQGYLFSRPLASQELISRLQVEGEQNYP